ncbi:MAG: PEP-CTERM sorting domain-containing protein [Thermodesulfobacteriota bacterium]|nr:PEP-CTERM sorting domain-containing protein [Thermodesulfobacteriota bacterium]
MKRLCVILLVLTFLLSFGLTISAHADPIILPNEPVFFQFNNIEQVDQSLTNSIIVPGGYGNAGNWGLFNVSSIQHGAVAIPHTDISGGPVWWADDGPGGTQGQITGIFYNINLVDGTHATGGIMDLYWHDAGSDTITATDMAGTTAGPDAATVARFTSGTLLARLNFMPGIIDGDNTTTILSDADLSISVSGHADSFADVDTSVVGAWTTQLDDNWFYVDNDGDGVYGETGEMRDIRFSNFFNGLPAWTDPTSPWIVGLRSNDPGRLYAQPIPEPATLLLLGTGLIGFAAVARRRLKKKD